MPLFAPSVYVFFPKLVLHNVLLLLCLSQTGGAVLLLLSGAAYIFTRKYFPLINPKHPVYSLFLQHLFQIAALRLQT